MWTKIAEHISQKTVEQFEVKQRRSVGGGCINQGYAVSNGAVTYFVKLNQGSLVDMFEAEALGLQQMWDTHTIRVPKPICCGTVDNSAYIVLEWLELGRSAGTNAWEEMGRNLAAMHKATSNQGFGWERNNTIGSTPQINTWTADWVEFFTQHRIGYQLKLAKRRGGYFRQGERLLEAIAELLADYKPQPSLVHGDLWSGNASVTVAGEPVIFDPATYYGDRETDLALLHIRAAGLIAADWGDSDQLAVGASVWALGSPFGLQSTITGGLVSAKDRAGQADCSSQCVINV